MTWCVKKIVVRLRLFDRRFLAVLQFAYCVRRNRFLVSIVVQQLFSCRSQRGEFCEPPRGGASARTAEAGLYFYKPQPPEHLFLPPFRVAASCIFQSAAEFSNNVQVMGISRSLALCPGPARIEDATPAAGPGENLGGHSVPKPIRNNSIVILRRSEERRRICNLAQNRFLTALRLSFSSLRRAAATVMLSAAKHL